MSNDLFVAKAAVTATGTSVKKRMPDWLADIAKVTTKQTLSAALPTDGTATNAQIATAINAIRSALIANGIGQ